jgi:hypothetical protein
MHTVAYYLFFFYTYRVKGKVNENLNFLLAVEEI